MEEGPTYALLPLSNIGKIIYPSLNNNNLSSEEE